MFKKSLLIASTAAALALSGTAQAATVLIDNIRASWGNAQGSPSNYNTTGWSGDRSVYWGNGTKNGGWQQSGYNFKRLGNEFELEVNAPNSSPTFDIGQFTHYNQPITGNTITAIQLFLTADVTIDSVKKNYSFTFDFTHDETDNIQSKCPYGGPAANSNGCADLVTVNFNSISDSFEIDGTRYTVNLQGFVDGSTPATQFISKEKGNNSATVVAQIAAWNDVVPGVPEPATWLTMIAGFGMVGYQMRRRSRNDRSAMASA